MSEGDWTINNMRPLKVLPRERQLHDMFEQLNAAFHSHGSQSVEGWRWNVMKHWVKLSHCDIDLNYCIQHLHTLNWFGDSCKVLRSVTVLRCHIAFLESFCRGAGPRRTCGDSKRSHRFSLTFTSITNNLNTSQPFFGMSSKRDQDCG